ncbi:hypothetical protein Tco_0564727 [Tanacetum coccineum]
MSLNTVMAISVISISSDSSEDSVGTPVGFGSCSPIPHGRPYRYHLNGPVHMMTARKRVGPLPTHRLARHSLSDHSSPDLPSTSAGPSHKRLKDSGYLADVEVDPREISLRDDAIIRVSDEPHLEQDIDPEIQAEINECIAYADALRDRGIDDRVVVEAVDRDETETGVRGPVEVRVERVTHPAMPEDILEPAQEGAVEVTYETLGDLVQRKMPNTRSEASMTHEEVEELVTRRVAEEMEARKAARTLEPLNDNGDEQEGEDEGNGNGGNGNGENEMEIEMGIMELKACRIDPLFGRWRLCSY